MNKTPALEINGSVLRFDVWFSPDMENFLFYPTPYILLSTYDLQEAIEKCKEKRGWGFSYIRVEGWR